ncbi:MAG: fimbrillin family protein [Bacteroidetes bacterium]|uniref:Fimbrillin family protein n=1 Tax=Candidatus Cryptobacteroides merdavium TaxID=2840769 RepID=A0A9D9HBY0_9BACT|nr:fimbrillin family protein [Candidatus Cryptobacteroides merdavium]
MKSYKFFLYAAAILPAAVSCDRSVLPGGDGGSDEVEVTGKIDIRTAVGPIVKSPQLGQDGSGNFVSGDMFRLTVSGEAFDDISEIYTVGETELFWSDLELPDNSGTVYFSGCYPVQDAVSDGSFRFDMPTDGETDLLLAKAVDVEYPAATVDLKFGHAFHKLAVKYVSDGTFSDSDLSQVTTVVNAMSSCTVDLSKGEIEAGSASVQSRYAEKSGDSVAYMLVPQQKDKVTVDVSFQGMKKTFTLPDTTEDGHTLSMLEGGKMLSVRLVISSDGIRMDGVQIIGWESQGTVNGSISF